MRQSVRAIDLDGTPARNLWEWYSKGIRGSLRRLLPATGVTVLVFVVAFIAGVVVGTLPQWQLPIVQQASVDAPADTMERFNMLAGGGIPVSFYVIQNGRILLAALILAVFSFGVAALVVTPAVYVVLGYLLSQVIISGNSPLLIAAAVIPHGIVEIPVIIMATAASLQLGAVVTRPPKGTTVGQAWFRTLGDSLKIYIGLVLPGLVLAGLLEAYLTPYVVQWAWGLLGLG
jgi:stage II sporulation protein M